MKKCKKITWLLTFMFIIPLVSCHKTSSSSLKQSEEISSSETSVSASITTSEALFPIAHFLVTSPIDIPENASIKLAGDFNSWKPLDPAYILTHVSGRNYTYTCEFSAADVGRIIQYKYVLLYDNQAENMWEFVEGNSMGGEIGNRSYKLKAGINDINDTIRSFKNNMDKTTLTRGTLKIFTMTMAEFNDNRTRRIRVWLPDNYDENDKTTRYPVMYMHDGQNLFDAYTAYSGEWKIDEAIGEMMDEGYRGTIIVGIDNGGEKRLDEYSPTWPFIIGDVPLINPEGEKYARFIVETLKPHIDQNFNTLSDRAHTGIGGSSMGGIISFFTALEYQETFGYAVIFSSSFWVYEESLLGDFLSAKVKDVHFFPKMYIYHGAAEGSDAYFNRLISLLKLLNIPETQYAYKMQAGGTHTEASWARAFPEAYKWLVGI